MSAINRAPSSAARNLRVLWLGQFLVTAGLTVIVPLLPFYLEELGCLDARDNHFWTGWTLAAPALPLVIMAPVWGRLGDRFGRKAMVVRALLGIALAVVAMALARSAFELFLCRLAQGAFGGVDDAAAAFTSTEVPDHERGRAIGTLQSATAAGALVGPLAGGFLSSYWGFAPMILVTGTLIACCAALAACTLAETRAAGHCPGGEIRSPLLVMRSVLRDRPARAFLVAGLFVQIGGYGLIGPFANRLRELVADPAAAVRWVGALQALTWTATLIGAGYWGRRNDRVPVEKNFAFAAAACAVSVGAQALPTAASWLAPLRAAHGFFGSALGQSVFLRVTLGADAKERGLRIGLANSLLTFGQIAGALGSAALAGLVSARALFAVMACAFLLAAVAIAHGAGLQRRSDAHVRPFAPRS